VGYIVKQKFIGDRYSLGDLVGSGGMAAVFLAHDEVLKRDVALKVLREPYAGDEGFVERFRREAQSAASLSHPHIVHTYDWGRLQDGGAYYMAMEYVPGGTLKDRILEGGALPPRTALEVASQIAEALVAAHECGVIHRDVKPQNVLLTDSGEAKVADFGLSRAANAATTSRSGLIMGTAGYMPPERAKGEPAGPRSDLYSLGVVLYEMLTGEMPYEDGTPVTVATKHITEPLRSPREVNHEIPEEIDALTSRLLAKDPDDRYGSAAELLEDLRRVGDGLPPTSADAGPVSADPGGAGASGVPYVVYGRRSRRLPWALAAFAALLALLGVVAWGPWSGSEEQAQARNAASGALDGSGPTFEEGDRTAAPKKEASRAGSLPEDEGQEGPRANIGSPELVDLDPASGAAVLPDGASEQGLRANIPADRANIPVELGTRVVDATESSGSQGVRNSDVSEGSVEEVSPEEASPEEVSPEEASPGFSDAGQAVATGTVPRHSSEPAGTVTDTGSSSRPVAKQGTAVSIVVSGGTTTREGGKGGEDTVRETTTLLTQPSKSRKPNKELSRYRQAMPLVEKQRRG
jgi:hypothetical protein